jgi:hypothetical protein
LLDCYFREYTQLAVRDITDYQYVEEDHAETTTLHVEKYHIARAVPGDPMPDIIDSSLVSTLVYYFFSPFTT